MTHQKEEILNLM